MQYSFEMTPEQVRTAAGELEAVLWLQNERLHQNLVARMPWRPRLRVAGMVLCVVGFVLALVDAALAPRLRMLLIGAMALFALIFVIFVNAEALARAMRRGTRRLVARNARRGMAPLIRQAPYTVEYTVEDDRIAIHASALGVSATIPLSRVQLAIVAPSLICVFARPFGQRPLRVLYVPGPAESALLEETLTKNEVEVIRVA